MSEELQLQEIKSLLRELLRLNYVQHQDLIWALCPNEDSVWLRRFALGHRLQKNFKLFTNEEWNLIQKHDLPLAFKRWPQMVEAWKKVRKHYSEDSKAFIDEVITCLENQGKLNFPKKNKNNK